jgi:hypothetical protein
MRRFIFNANETIDQRHIQTPLARKVNNNFSLKRTTHGTPSHYAKNHVTNALNIEKSKPQNTETNE